MSGVEICSLNVNGLRDKIKCQTVLSFFKRKYKGVIMLQETHSVKKDEKTWSELANANCYFAHGTSESRGVATIISNEIDIKVNNVISDPDGRFLILDVLLKDSSFVLLNTYAPTKDKASSQLSFLDKLSDIMKDYLDRQIIWAGDLNTYLQPEIDKQGGVKESQSEYALNIMSIMDNLDLVDIWRIRNPESLKFTWRNRTRAGVVQSRLDYFLVSSCIANMINRIDIVPGIRSDHSMLYLYLETDKSERRGKGFWKFNSSLLKDKEYVVLMRNCIKNTMQENNHLCDKGLLLDLIKCKIRGDTISYSIKKKRQENKHETDVLEDIMKKENMLSSGDTDVMQDLKRLKDEYNTIQDEKAQGIIVRSRANWAEYGEKNTKYFLQLERRNHNVKHIKSLITDNGVVHDPKDILEAERLFYSDLYTEKKDVNSDMYDSVFLKKNNVKTVGINTYNVCEQLLTLDECHTALEAMANNKTPGTDGLSVEFYKYFWDDMKCIILDSFNYAFETGTLSVEQRRGVITLVPKKDKDVRYIKNWRPITLLNIDYKILTKALGNRLQVALGEIISADQTGYIKGRYIGENIRVIDDIITYTSLNNVNGYILLLDFEKAFDTVNIEFLKAALKIFKFGPVYMKWINVLYANVSSCVINNGYASKFFSITRGIRQGCPISAMLFIIVAELLSTYLKSCKDVKGIDINNVTFLITQLADDTTLFLNDKDSISYVLYVMDLFYESSGLRLNKQKSEVYILGNCGQSDNSPSSIHGVKCVKGPFKALGIYFSNDPQEVLQKNFTDKLNNVKITMNMWMQRDLSLKGKITVLKSILIPALLFQCNSLFVPKEFIVEVNKLLFKFLWNNKPSKIKADTIIADVQDGGLRMPHFPTIVEGMKVLWVKKLLDVKSSNWKALAWQLANVSEFDLMCKCDVKQLKTFSPFYGQVLHAWYNLHAKEPKGEDEICNEIIWNNKYITVDGRTIFYKQLYDKGVVQVRDLLSKEGKLLTYIEFKNQYKVKINFLEYGSLVNAIPTQWVQKLTVNVPTKPQSFKDSFYDYVRKLQSNKIYWNRVAAFVRTPTALDKWISEFPFINDSDFKDFFTLPMYVTRETKLQCFQFKILHRIFPCNDVLKIWGIKDCNHCVHCNEQDTIEHFLFYCDECRSFWLNVENWFHQTTRVLLPLRITNILFGIPFNRSQDKLLFILNFIVLHGKWFIYKCKREENHIRFVPFLRYLKNVLYVEKDMAILMKKEQEFDTNWTHIINSM